MSLTIMLVALVALMAGAIYFFREIRKAGRAEATVREIEKDLRAWEEANETLKELDRVGRDAVAEATAGRVSDSSGNGLPDDGWKRDDPR